MSPKARGGCIMQLTPRDRLWRAIAMGRSGFGPRAWPKMAPC